MCVKPALGCGSPSKQVSLLAGYVSVSSSLTLRRFGLRMDDFDSSICLLKYCLLKYLFTQVFVYSVMCDNRCKDALRVENLAGYDFL